MNCLLCGVPCLHAVGFIIHCDRDHSYLFDRESKKVSQMIRDKRYVPKRKLLAASLSLLAEARRRKEMVRCSNVR